VWLALTHVITSYMGVEVVAVTAGEAANPEASIPRAMRSMVLRLIIFYLGPPICCSFGLLYCSRIFGSLQRYRRSSSRGCRSRCSPLRSAPCVAS
jgi:amino acid permease